MLPTHRVAIKKEREPMKRQTILTLLLVAGITVFAFGVATTGLFAFSGAAAATLLPILIGYPIQNR